MPASAQHVLRRWRPALLPAVDERNVVRFQEVGGDPLEGLVAVAVPGLFDASAVDQEASSPVVRLM
jgi:hypothetical protein